MNTLKLHPDFQITFFHSEIDFGLSNPTNLPAAALLWGSSSSVERLLRIRCGLREVQGSIPCRRRPSLGVAPTISKDMRMRDGRPSILNIPKAGHRKLGGPIHPAIRLLGSPTHLIFQIIKLTTLPYMCYQLIYQNQREKANSALASASSSSMDPIYPNQAKLLPSQKYSILSFLRVKSNSESKRFYSSGHHQTNSVANLDHSHLHRIFHSSLETTSLFHNLLRNPDLNYSQLINLLNHYLDLDQPPKLHPKTINQIFLATRDWLRHQLLHLNSSNPSSSLPSIQNSTNVAWKAEAMAQIVQRWKNVNSSKLKKSNAENSLFHPNSSSQNDLINKRKLNRIKSRQEAFLSKGPPTCDCQRSSLPLIRIRINQLGSFQTSTLEKFIIHFQKSLDMTTYLRIIDLNRQAHRWDLAVIFLDQVQLPFKTSNKSSYRHLGQVTGLLQFLKSPQTIQSNLDPLKLWCVHFLCESLERRLLKNPSNHEWARVNKLSLDVLVHYASLSFASSHQNLNLTPNQNHPNPTTLLDNNRHQKLLAAIESGNESKFAMMTRDRCERLLSYLTRLIITGKSSQHCWSGQSSHQLRLLDYLARKGTDLQFKALLQHHLQYHSTTPKLARIILLAGRRFQFISQNLTLIKQILSSLDPSSDFRPVIDFMLRPDQHLETLKNHLKICLNALPSDKAQRISFYSHLIYRLSQLKTPTLALGVWELVNLERARKLVRVGRRTRHLRKSITKAIDELPIQMIRSMIYVYRNLTKPSEEGEARGKWYQKVYERLKLRRRLNRRRWPISRKFARGRLIETLVKEEIKRMDGSLLRAIENSEIEDERLKGLIKFILNVKNGEKVLINRFDENNNNEKWIGKKILEDWIESRGGFQKLDGGQKIRKNQTKSIVLSRSNNHLKSKNYLNGHSIKRKKGSLSRFWSQVVALEN
ncbi:hypothetical protein O181_039941 [Austropuccinia psidii MF-1]|uniref:Uncharacterized protein n=1 Tax=Austropuccinia psidii MF-1 TaxID=1389203 RepID=A0A9Q3DGV3_9BASI|nr:hypothetical protein [Austropuccinia psidii MF-1]